VSLKRPVLGNKKPAEAGYWFSQYSSGHLAALLCTVMTGFGTFLTVVMVMLTTFITALLANICAQLTNFVG